MPRKAINFEVAGLENIMKNIRDIVKGLDDPEKIKPVFFVVAKVIRDDAKRRAPKLTGALQLNIFAGTRRTKIPSAVVGVRSKKIRYNWATEVGNSHNNAQPYLRPAAASDPAGKLSMMRDELNRQVFEAILS